MQIIKFKKGQIYENFVDLKQPNCNESPFFQEHLDFDLEQTFCKIDHSMAKKRRRYSRQK